jgi:hypothetical protein
MKRLGVFLFLFLVSCATLREDPSMPATDADFHTAEAIVRGERFRGIKIVSIKKGEPLSSLDLKIQGIFSGSVKVNSSNCGIDKFVSYRNSEQVQVDISGAAISSCIITFYVSPQYNSKFSVTYGMKGILAVRVLEEDQPWLGRAISVASSGRANIFLDLREQLPVRVVLSGCGVEYKKTIEPDASGNVVIPVEEISLNRKDRCIASGYVVSEEYETLYFDFLIIRHDADFIDLPKPSVVVLNDRRVCVYADSSVSFIMTESSFSNCNQACFSDPKIIRGVTNKGRTFLGEMKNGNVEWK